MYVDPKKFTQRYNSAYSHNIRVLNYFNKK